MFFTLEPRIIQGGMGVAVSNWRLARAVSMLGQMGVVSGTAIEGVLARRLQLGDPDGHMRRAMEAFPNRAMAERVWERYFVPLGKEVRAAFKSKPLHAIEPTKALAELTIVANFVEVWLAKEGHRGPVGINLMEKIQLPTLLSVFGAMIAGVDYVLMGAGIPRQMAGAIDRLAAWDQAEYRLDVAGAHSGQDYRTRLNPAEFLPDHTAGLHRPKFLPIITSATLAVTLARKSTGKVDGFIVEGQTAGGHNAPPRGVMQLDDKGEPIYGPRDIPDYDAIREVGLPFWIAGSYAAPEKLQEALAVGAAGVQIGTAFAFCEESGIVPELKQKVLRASMEGSAGVFTDPKASPTGFPFKVVTLAGTLAEQPIYESRSRICDLGYLRHTYVDAEGKVGYRCPAEPVEDFVRKGGDIAETEGRKCVCNGLFATIGLAQVRKDGYVEPPIMTAGDDVANVARFLKPGKTTYTAEDVVNHILSGELAVV